MGQADPNHLITILGIYAIRGEIVIEKHFTQEALTESIVIGF